MATTITVAPAVQTQVVHVPAAVLPPPPPPGDHPAKKFKKVFMVTGISLTITGVLSFIMAAVALSPAVNYRTYSASGMWSGAWYIVSGGLAISSGVTPNSCNVIAGMVVSILASLVAFGVGCSEAVLASVCNPYNSGYTFYYCSLSYKGIHGTIAFLAFLACVLAIVHSSYCCCGSCCQTNYRGGIVTTTYTTAPVPVQHVYGQSYPQQSFNPPLQQTVMQAQPPAYYQPQPGQAYGAQVAAGYAVSPQQLQPGAAHVTQPAFAPPPYTDQKQHFQ